MEPVYLGRRCLRIHGECRSFANCLSAAQTIKSMTPQVTGESVMVGSDQARKMAAVISLLLYYKQLALPAQHVPTACIFSSLLHTHTHKQNAKTKCNASVLIGRHSTLPRLSFYQVVCLPAPYAAGQASVVFTLNYPLLRRRSPPVPTPCTMYVANYSIIEQANSKTNASRNTITKQSSYERFVYQNRTVPELSIGHGELRRPTARKSPPIAPM